MKTNLKYRFIEFIVQNDLIQPGENILVAVSGGPDSMVLLHLLRAWQKRLKVDLGGVYLHHGIRGRAADADFRFVEKVCREFNLPFYGLRESVPDYAREHRLSLEEAGHQLREHLFENLAQQKGYAKIATGHHLDDQAETLLQRLISGTGLQGLIGIRLQKGRWIRPLLFASRDSILTYARENNLPFREDETNEDLSIPRNKIRHRLLPLLEKEYNPKVKEHLQQLSFVLQEWDDYNEKQLEQIVRNGKLRIAKNKIHLDIHAFKQYFSWFKIRLVEYVLGVLTGKAGKVVYRQFRSFLYWLEKGKPGTTFLWQENVGCFKDGEKLVFCNYPGTPTSQEETSVEENQWYDIPLAGYRFRISAVSRETVHFSANKEEEFIDGSALQFPLYLRRWKHGDRFVPLGLPSEKLVSDFLTDLKMKQPEKQNVQVLLNGKEIVALPGFQISEKYRVRPDSSKIFSLILKMET